MALGFYAAAFAHATVVSGEVPRFDAEAVSIPAMLAALGQGRATPAVVIASLLEEMRRESESDGFAAAMGVLG